MLVYVFIKPTYPTSDVTTFGESAVYILFILQKTSELKEIVYYSKRRISLLFHALSHKTTQNNKNFYCQCPLNIFFKQNSLKSFFNHLDSTKT